MLEKIIQDHFYYKKFAEDGYAQSFYQEQEACLRTLYLLLKERKGRKFSEQDPQIIKLVNKLLGCDTICYLGQEKCDFLLGKLEKAFTLDHQNFANKLEKTKAEPKNKTPERTYKKHVNVKEFIELLLFFSIASIQLLFYGTGLALILLLYRFVFVLPHA